MMDKYDIEAIGKESEKIIAHLESYFELNNFLTPSILSALVVLLTEIHVNSEADDFLLFVTLDSLFQELRELGSTQ